MLTIKQKQFALWVCIANIFSVLFEKRRTDFFELTAIELASSFINYCLSDVFSLQHRPKRAHRKKEKDQEKDQEEEDQKKKVSSQTQIQPL